MHKLYFLEETSWVPNLTRYGASYENAIQPVLEALEEQVVLLRLLGEAVGAQPGEVAKHWRLAAHTQA